MFCGKRFEISAFVLGGKPQEETKKNNNKKEGGNFVPHNAFTGNFQHLKTSITEEKGINSC